MTTSIESLDQAPPGPFPISTVAPTPTPVDRPSPVTSARVPPAPLPNHPLGIVDQLLKDRTTFLEQIERPEAWLRVARTMLVTILVGTSVFGGAMGAFRPGWQMLSSGVKLPLVLLLTAGLCAPALTALLKAYGHETNLQKDLVLVLTTLGLTSLVLAALAPVLLLVVFLGAAYHEVIMMVVSICAIGGLVGFAFFSKGLRQRSGPGVRTAIMVALTLFMMVAAQMTWTMRPFVARPRADFAWIRSQEGTFMKSVMTSADSARGVYHRSEAPLPTEK